jgi:hypothetical protein
MILSLAKLYYLCVALTGSCLVRCDFRQVLVIVAQLVRAPDCGSGGRGFNSRLSPLRRGPFRLERAFFLWGNDK